MARHHRLRTAGPLAVLCVSVLIGGAGRAQQTAPAAPLTGADAAARETFVRVCVKCHPVERVTAEGRSRTQWENTIVAMQTSQSAIISPEEFDTVLDYLTKFHGRDPSAPTAPVGAAGAPGAAG